MNASTDPPVNKHSPFLALLLIFVVCAVGGITYTIVRLHNEAIDFHTKVIALQTRMQESQLTESLNVVDLLLARLLADASNSKHNYANFGEELQVELRHMPMIRSLSLVDEQQRIIASSNPRNLGRQVDVQHFQPVPPTTTSEQSLLRVGTPWSGRDFADAYLVDLQHPANTSQRFLIPVVRQLHQGQHTWTVLAAINPDFFRNQFAQSLGSAAGATVELLRYDGVVLLSSQPQDTPGDRHQNQALARVNGNEEFGTYEDSGAPAPRLSAFRASKLFPLLIVTHIDRDLALSSWRNERQTMLWLVVPALLAVIGMITLIDLRNRRLVKARELSKQEERLRLSALINALPASLVMLDTSGHVAMSNRGWMQFVRDANLEVAQDGAGMHWLAVLHPVLGQDSDTLSDLARNVHQVLSGEQEVADLEIHTVLPTGERWFQTKVHALHDAGLVGAVVMLIDISDRIRAENDMRQVMEAAGDAILISDLAGHFSFANPSACQAFGYTSRELLGMQIKDILTEEGQRYFPTHAAILEQQPYDRREWAMKKKDGEVVPMELVTQRLGHQRYLAVGHDITERKKSEARLHLAASVFTHARESIMITDPEGNIIDVNETFTKITGYPLEDVAGKNPRILKSGRQNSEFYAAMWGAILEHGYWMGEVWNRRKTGEVYAQILTISAVWDSDGVVKNYVALASDITPMKEHQKQLERIAHFDALTGLPNRVLFADRLDQALRHSERRERALSVVYLDLDGFKNVNDSYGHAVGDELLITVSKRMKAALREGDSLARFGGDEFVAILVDLEQPGDCIPVLERLLQACSTPVLIHSGESQIHLRVSASIGATIYPMDGADADLLMRHADQAMYMAKQAGRSRYHLFDVDHDSAVRNQRERLEEIRNALDSGEFCLHYQPKVDLHSGKVIGVEALIRWQHPQRGLLAPAAFLPLIETHALSIAVGDWVLHTALTQMDTWHDGGLTLPVSVNVGAMQLQQDNFATQLGELLASHPRIAPASLELEILESSAMEDIAKVAKVIHACRDLGVRFSLDDFGTGFSSLTYLKHLPAESLKIDQSFIRDMLNDADDLAIVNGVIGLAQAFNRSVIAEGVETQEHCDALRAIGCPLVQGYEIARPMPATDVADWVRQWENKAPA